MRTTESPRGGRIADGGRTERTRERFVMRFVPGVPHRLFVRFEAQAGTIKVRAGNSTAELTASPGEWSEQAATLVTLTPLAEVTLEASEPVTVYHYWLAIDGERR